MRDAVTQSLSHVAVTTAQALNFRIINRADREILNLVILGETEKKNRERWTKIG